MPLVERRDAAGDVDDVRTERRLAAGDLEVRHADGAGGRRHRDDLVR